MKEPSQTATKRRSDKSPKEKVTEARSHGGTEREAPKPRSHDATNGNLVRTATVGSKVELRRLRLEKGVLAVLVVATSTISAGCVRRTISITTEPPNARVFLNDQEVGRSAVTTDFLWYGDYGVTIRKEGYETLETNWVIERPWYQHIPLDFFTEVLWPGQLHDTHSRHFVLEAAKTPTQEELIGRAVETRDRALDARK